MGKKNYKQAYSKYKPNVDFTAYVDHYPDLKNAWAMIEAKITGKDMSKVKNTGNPNLTPDQQADYWIKRMPVGNINDLAAAKKAFGQAHAAEDNALMIGKYRVQTRGRICFLITVLSRAIQTHGMKITLTLLPPLPTLTPTLTPTPLLPPPQTRI